MPATTEQKTRIARYLTRQAQFGPTVTAAADLTAISAAIDDGWDWVQSNKAGYVSALPAAFANGTNAAQKTRLLIALVLEDLGAL